MVVPCHPSDPKRTPVSARSYFVGSSSKCREEIEKIAPLHKTVVDSTRTMTTTPLPFTMEPEKSSGEGRRNQGPGKTANDNDRIFVVHNYHDYSNAMDEAEAPQELDTQIRRKSGVKQSFLHTLHEVLELAPKEGYNHIISWQHHGRCFVIHQPKEFVEQVMPR